MGWEATFFFFEVFSRVGLGEGLIKIGWDYTLILLIYFKLDILKNLLYIVMNKRITIIVIRINKKNKENRRLRRIMNSANRLISGL